jgi:hypothetical protein
LTWEEMSTLAVCLALDLLDYLVPFMMVPLYGDVLDFTGIAFTLMYFNWYGSLSILELVPGMDILPLYSITWLIWYLQSSSTRKKQIRDELENWR